MRILKNFSFFLLLIIVFSQRPAIGQVATSESSRGSLNVYSKLGFLKVYLDNDFIGETPVEIEQVKVGTHLLSALDNGDTIWEDVVLIKEGEVTTVLVSESNKKAKENEPKEESARSRSENIGLSFQSLYGRLGYMSSTVLVDRSYIYTSSSSLVYAVGYKLSLDPYVGIILEAARADFGSPDATWYIVPLTLNFQLSYPLARGFSGLTYVSLGIGNYMTDFSYQGSNLSAVGYNISNGYEFPVGGHGSAFIDINYAIAENGKVQSILYSTMISFGYRMNI